MTDHPLDGAVRSANPFPDPERAAGRHDAARTLLLLIDQRTYGVDTRHRSEESRTDPNWVQPIPIRPVRRRATPIGVLAAGVAFALVLLAGVAALIATSSDDPDDAATTETVVSAVPDPVSEDVATVEAFFAAMTRGDAEAAIALLHPDIRDGATGDPADFIEYSVAIGIGFSASECVDSVGGQVTCYLEAINDPVVAALDLGGQTQNLEVTDGLISRLRLPNYGEADRLVADFAREADPAGYEEACGGDSGSGDRNSVIYDRDCGEFLSLFVNDFLASR